jgi:Na+/H+-dicarboxylate symporter
MMDDAPKNVSMRRLSATTLLLVAMILGGLCGAVLGPRVVGIGAVGGAVISFIKMLAGPLIFFAVVDAFLRTNFRAKSGLIIVGISAVNATLAVAIGLTLVNMLQPGRLLAVPVGASTRDAPVADMRPIRFVDELFRLSPTNIVDPFQTNAIIPIVVLAVLAGSAARRNKNEQVAAGGREYLTIERFVAGGLRSLEITLEWVPALLPVAVFSVMAQTVGTQGLEALRGLAAYIGVVILGLAIHVGLVYHAWVIFVARAPLRMFWQGLRAPLACAAASSSSLATLPVTLRGLKSMRVSDGAARMAACVATNLNNDGILLYEAMGAVIVAQAHGIGLTFAQQLSIAATCVLASVGIAGVPEAGLITLSVVLANAKLPLDLLPLLLSVDWMLGRCRAMTNVVGDFVGAVVLDALDPALPDPQANEPIPYVNESSVSKAVA